MTRPGYAALAAATTLLLVIGVSGAGNASRPPGAGTSIAKTPPSPKRDAAFWEAQARAELDAGNMAAAYAASALALTADPQFGPALVLGGQLAQRRYGLRASLSWFRAALAQDPDNRDALVELAAALGDLGANREMLAVVDHLLAVHPRDRWGWYFRAVMAARAGKYVLARAMLDRVGDALADEPGVMLLTAVLDLDRGAPEKASLGLRRLVARQPGNLAARRLLALALWRAGDAKGAEGALAPLISRVDADSYSLILAADVAERRGDRARSDMLRGRTQVAVRVPAQPLLGAGPAGDIAEALSSNQVDRAVSHAQIWRAAQPGHPAPYLGLGDALAAKANWAGAVAAYRDAANLSFDERTALRLAQALVAIRQEAAARQTLQLYLHQNPQNIAVRLALADLDLGDRRWSQAITQLEILRDRLGNGDASLLARLGWAWHGMQDRRRALLYAQAATRRLPDDPRLRSQMAVIEASARQSAEKPTPRF